MKFLREDYSVTEPHQSLWCILLITLYFLYSDLSSWLGCQHLDDDCSSKATEKKIVFGIEVAESLTSLTERERERFDDRNLFLTSTPHISDKVVYPLYLYLLILS